MLTPDTNKHLHALLDAHSETFAAMRLAIQELEAASAAHQRVAQAQDHAITAALKANRAIVDVLHALGNETPPTP